MLGLLREGLSNEEIAERLGITLRTAKFHVSEILSKLGVESREQAASWQPEAAPAPTRRWLAWPLIARFAGALVVVSAVAGLGLLAWGVLRTAGDDADSLPVDPEGLVGDALKRMESLDSYQLDVVDSEGEGSATVEVTRGGLTAVRRTEITSGDLNVKVVKESIYGVNAWYDRLCQDYPVSCGPWIESRSKDPSPPMFVPIGETVPSADWPLIVLEYARDVRFRTPDSARPEIVEITGTVELYAALDETLRRHLPSEEAPTNRGPVLAAISVSISLDGATIERIIVDLPESYLSSEKTLGFYYSHFNEISVARPTDFVPMPDVPSPTP